MKHELRLFFIALQFFTRVPVPAWVGYQPAWLNQSARHFPLVGAVVGSCAAAAFVAASLVFAPALAAWLAIACTMVVTGAFHEDGLADTCDALGGAVARARALEIMKDSRIGTYGAAALILVLAIKAHAIAAVARPHVVAALVLAHAASRAVPVALIRLLPYASDPDAAKAKPLAAQVSSAGLVVAVAWGALAAAAVGWSTGEAECVLASCATAFVVGLSCGRWYRRRVGGFTGDLLGATQQLCEVAMLLVWAAWPQR